MMEYIGWAKPKQETAVKDSLDDLGISCRVALRARFRRIGKERSARLVLEPYFPGLIFAELRPQDFERMRNVRHLGATWNLIPGQRNGRRIGDAANLDDFFLAVDREIDHARALEGAAERRKELLAAYVPGQAVQVLTGPLRERIAQFVRLVQSSHDAHPFIEAEFEMLGRTTRLRVDPLDVKAAE